MHRLSRYEAGSGTRKVPITESFRRKLAAETSVQKQFDFHCSTLTRTNIDIPSPSRCSAVAYNAKRYANYDENPMLIFQCFAYVTKSKLEGSFLIKSLREHIHSQNDEFRKNEKCERYQSEKLFSIAEIVKTLKNA